MGTRAIQSKIQGATGFMPRVSILTLMVITALGCRSKLDVETKAGAPLPQTDKVGNPPVTAAGDKKSDSPKKKEEIATKKEIAGIRSYFQSRDTISFTVDHELVDGSTNFSIFNVTDLKPEQEDDAPIVIKDHPVLGANLTTTTIKGDGYFTKAVDTQGNMLISILARDNNVRKSFKYGINKLKILVNGDQEGKFSYSYVIVKDFNIFGSTMTSYPGNKQVATSNGDSGYRFEGWVNLVAPVAVKDKTGETVLSVGVFNMLHTLD